MQYLKTTLRKIHDLFHIPNWLFFVLFAVVILRIPNFFEPYSYGDETIYLTLGQGIRKGFTLYKDLHDNKPPLLYVTAAFAGNLFWFKAVLLITSLIGTAIFHRFCEKLFPKIKYFAVVSTIIFAILITLPFFEGNIVNAENLMIVPTFAAFYILLFKKDTNKNIFLSGLLFSIASLYKIPAFFDIPAVIFLWLITEIKRKNGFVKFVKRSLVLMSGVALPIIATFIYYFAKGAFSEYLVAAYLQNFGYVSSWRPDSQKDPFLVKNAPLLIRAGIVFVIHIFLFAIRNKISKRFIFIISWITFSLFGVTLSERPYPHYLLQTAAPLAVLMGLLFTSSSMLQLYSIFPLTLFFLVPLYFQFWHYRASDYYMRITSYLSGKVDKSSYLRSFGGRTFDNYEISNVIRLMTEEDDRVFVWEDSAQIYALSNRIPPTKYVAGYHINDFSSIDSTISDFSQNMPKVIVLFESSNPPSKLLTFVQNYYILYKETPNYQIWRLGGDSAKFIISK